MIALSKIEAAARAMCVSWGYSADHDPNDDQTVAPDGEEATYCPRPSMQQFRDAARAAVLAFLEAAKRDSADPYAITTIVALARMAEAAQDE